MRPEWKKTTPTLPTTTPPLSPEMIPRLTLEIRRRIYLTIMSSVDFEEAGHWLVEIVELEPGQEELSEQLGVRQLKERLNDPDMKDYFGSIFPKDRPKNTSFSINFFTSIGLGGITEGLRNYLKSMPRHVMQQQKPASSESESSSDENDRRPSKRRRKK